MFRTLAAWLMPALLLLSSPVLAAGGGLLFGVNEGTSSSLDAMFRHEKYAPLTAHLSAAAGKPVKTETSNILPILVRNIGKAKYDILLVRPSHISAMAMRDHGYRLLVAAKGESKLHFLVRGDSPLRSLADLRGKRIAFPDPMAYPTRLAGAVLRDAGLDLKKEDMLVMDRQEAVSYAVREGMVDAGVVISYSKPAKEWLAKGGRFLHTKDKLPYWSILVSNKVGEATAAKLREALLTMDQTPKGQAILKDIGIQGFAAGDQQAYLDMLAWVEGKGPAR
ncbi:MAG: phosphate/phosphite/phosphonate ABC transporter substrate-binding protein [Pseudomonadota bacterium]